MFITPLSPRQAVGASKRARSAIRGRLTNRSVRLALVGGHHRLEEDELAFGCRMLVGYGIAQTAHE